VDQGATGIGKLVMAGSWEDEQVWVAGVGKKGITKYGGEVTSKTGKFDGLDKHLWDPQWGEIYEKGNCRSCDLTKEERLRA